MNALLWIIQVVLALLYFAGGAYKVFMFDELANQIPVLPRGVWPALGVFEMSGAVLLVVPAAKWTRQIPLAASALALETLALAGLYARYSLQLVASNPMVWALAIGLLALFVAYGRSGLGPSAGRRPAW